MKLRPAVAQLLRADGQKDTHDEANCGFHNFAKAPNDFYNSSFMLILCICNMFVCAADSSWFFTVTGL